MTIREDIVASAAQFLQDPSVASSPVENRIAFLQSKNLTQEEVQAALTRAESPAAQSYSAPPVAPAPGQPQGYYGGYPPYGWQPPPPEVPKRDWRDWFIMATVVGGVGYGLFTLGKRYVYPLVAPPTPERLETDKKSIDEQFEKAFALVEQLSKDTEALKASEKERTERLDSALGDLETVITHIKSSNKRRDDEAERVRDDVRGLKDSIAKATEAQKSLADNRMQEVNSELKSLKTLISQRLNSTMNQITPTPSANNYLRPAPGNSAFIPAQQTPLSPARGASSLAVGNENSNTSGKAPAETPKPAQQNAGSANGQSSPFTTGASAANIRIPEWQRAKVTKKPSTPTIDSSADAGSSTQPEASSSSA